MFSNRSNAFTIDTQQNDKKNEEKERDANTDVDEFDFDVFSAVQQAKDVVPSNVARVNEEENKNIEKEKAIDELERYLEYCREIDWEDHVLKHRNVKYETKNTIVWGKITNKGDTLYCSQVLNLMSWWKTHSAAAMFPRVGILAAIYLGKPYTNGF